jgi:general secretion pathway protein D
MLIVRDNQEAIKLAEKLVALQDVAEPEVMLEVEILEVKRTRLTELGIKWPESLNLTPLPSVVGGSLTLQDLKSNINPGTISTTVTPLIINAHKQDSDANILANPRIHTRNHEKAKILIGERVPNITTTSTATGFVSESINYLDVGLKLEVEPTIFLDNDVAIKIFLEVSNIVGQQQTKSGTSAYQIGTRTASTVLRLKDGETQILAGLINDEDRSNANKIPGVGEIPVLGRLFGSTSDNGLKTEIVLSITPRLIRNIVRPDVSLAEFLAGTDSSLRNRPEEGHLPQQLLVLYKVQLKH